MSNSRNDNARPMVFARGSPPQGSLISHACSQTSPASSSDKAREAAVIAVAGTRAICR